MKKILLLQFRTDSSALHEKAYLDRFSSKCPLEVHQLNSLDNELDWSNPKKLIDGYDGVVIGGSGEFYLSEIGKENGRNLEIALTNTSPLVKYLIKEDFPSLGICFGHQLIAHHLGTNIRRDQSQSKSGSFSVSLTDDGKNDPVFQDMPETFIAQYGHKDSLEEIPKNTKLLVSGGNKCRTSALKHKNNIYTVQFHPEMNKEDLLAKINIYSDYIDDLDEFKKNLKDSEHTPKIIENFLQKIA